MKRFIRPTVAIGLVSAVLVAALYAADPPTGSKMMVSHSFRASKLTGLNVQNSQNEKLGTVDDLVIDVSTGRIAYVAMSFGGILGIGDKLFAVPYDQLKFVHDKDDMHFVLDVPKDRLKDAPGFDKSKWPDFADPNWSQHIDTYYRSTQVPARDATR